MNAGTRVRAAVYAARCALATAVAFALAACASSGIGMRTAADNALETRVATAIADASDLPANALTVEADDGVVRVIGSVVCESCGQMQTPGGIQSIQQSLGAVVRAVPGVERVEFDLDYRP